MVLLVDPTERLTLPERHQMVGRPSSPNGLIVGFREFWPKFDVFTHEFEGLLKSRYQVASVERVDGTHPRSGQPLERWQEFGRIVDWAISGLGGCGGCAPWAIMDAAELEGRGIPTVSLITSDLLGVARRTARSLGWPALRVVTMPEYLDDLSDEDISNLAEEKFEEILQALTTQLDPPSHDAE